jgi:hypothetical protein
MARSLGNRSIMEIYTVSIGPFAGMKLENNFAWKDGNEKQKLTSYYESELHPYIERMIARNHTCR